MHIRGREASRGDGAVPSGLLRGLTGEMEGMARICIVGAVGGLSMCVLVGERDRACSAV